MMSVTERYIIRISLHYFA